MHADPQCEKYAAWLPVTPGRQRASRAQPLTARTPWYGKGNSKTAHTRPLHTSAFGKCAARAGPDRRSGPKASWDQSRMAATRHEARGVAREPDGGTPGRTDAVVSLSCAARSAIARAVLPAATAPPIPRAAARSSGIRRHESRICPTPATQSARTSCPYKG